MKTPKNDKLDSLILDGLKGRGLTVLEIERLISNKSVYQYSSAEIRRRIWQVADQGKISLTPDHKWELTKEI